MKLFLPGLILLACSVTWAQVNSSVRYNEVYSIATHNSYWVKRALTVEPFATGTQERLLDQLLFDHVRALEIDIHKARGKKGEWRVYHTGKLKNTLFENFTDFLKQLQQFNYTLPKHEVVTVVIELKEIIGKNFDPHHTTEDFNSLLEKYLGESLFRPRDLMKRCPNANTLRDCLESSKEIWPAIDELRGKFIFLILGNFHWGIIGKGGLGWATYGASENQSAFPMFSDFSVFNTKKITSEKVPDVMLKQAYNASVFQQVENLSDTNHLKAVSKFIAGGGIVRGGNSFSLEEQHARLAAGFQLLQTDYPWIHLRDKGFTRPFQPINEKQFTDSSLFIEPGERIFVSSVTKTFFSMKVNDTLSDWETLPSSTRVSPNPKFPNIKSPYGKGCLRAEADTQNSVTVCRKVNQQQNAVVTVSIIENGNRSFEKFVSNNRTCGNVGDYIRLLIEKNSSGGCCTRIYSSSQMLNNVTPKWNVIYTKCFDKFLFKQGIEASEGDVLFTATKRNGKYVKTADIKQ